MSRVPSSFVIAVLALMISALHAGAALASDVGSIHFTIGRKSLTKDWYLGPPEFDVTGQLVEPGRQGQYSLGLETTWGRQGWPVLIAFDVFHSYDDGIIHVPAFFNTPAFDERLRASVFEAAIGVRRSFSFAGLTPYVGAGGSWFRPNVVFEVIDPNAGSTGTLLGSARSAHPMFGYWAGGGFYRRMGPRFQLGIGGRYSGPVHKIQILGPTTRTWPLYADGTNGQVVAQIPERNPGGYSINLIAGWSFPARK